MRRPKPDVLKGQFLNMHEKEAVFSFTLSQCRCESSLLSMRSTCTCIISSNPMKRSLSDNKAIVVYRMYIEWVYIDMIGL